MAKKIGHVVLVGALLISIFHGTCLADWDDWTRGLNEDLARMNDNLAHMQENIEHQVQGIIQNVNRQLENTFTHQVQPALEEAAKTIQNLPRDEHGRIISTFGSYGNTVIINNGNGLSKSVFSGRTKEGEPFVRDIEERNDGGILYHREIYYKPNTNTSVKTCWKLDHTTPGATPEILKDC
ncbi:uncharacterized protein LOC116852061 [Odontomachus brunneus]|uniref:uncharacterized protein LOC116852061 n=1 Tax=Odontomachus brunneus TaxID=486640 RepID=UPI0013F1BF96|nr:uncharacterized protein LOC116852061 [Odontomachus brunneus]